MKTVSIFGATGSVGQSTLKVVGAHKDKYDVQVLTANSNVKALAKAAIESKASKAIVADEAVYTDLKEALSGTHIEVAAGEEAILEAASQPVDWTMAAIVGMAGLKPLMAAIERGGTIAIANKEPLVSAGPQVMDAAQKSGATLLPVDSEHNAIFQALDPSNKDQVSRIIITASGGPFLNTPIEKLKSVTAEQALNHPVWSMGTKISIDSATMMNKALELIEAHIFFEMPAKKIEAIIHPQSIIHSMVEYVDGSILAQMGAPDMCTPITHALGYPERIDGVSQKLDFSQIQNLSFEPVDHKRFPAIQLAYDAMKAGQGTCLAMNAANEVAVDAFLNNQIGYLDIVECVKNQMSTINLPQNPSINDVIFADEEVRKRTKQDIVSIQDSKPKVA